MSKKSERPKVYVLDTSALIHDPRTVNRLGDNTVIIPISVLSELDKLKVKDGNLGFNAREAIAVVEKLTGNGFSPGDIAHGVRTNAGGRLLFDLKDSSWTQVPDGLERKNDTRILIAAKNAHDKFPGSEVIILSQDVNLRVISRSCGIKAEDYRNDRMVEDVDNLYSGRVVATLPPEQAGYLQTLYHERRLPVKAISCFLPERELYPNECVELVAGDNYAVGVHEKGFVRVIPMGKTGEKEVNCPVSLRTPEQYMGYHLVQKSRLELNTLVGKTGSGKTFLALMAAYIQTRTDDAKRIMVFRPHVELGPEFGILPGDINEKFAPWARPVRENMLKIISLVNNVSRDQAGISLTELIRNGYLEINPISHIRGCTFDDAVIVIDEGQNLTPHEMRSTITRAGEGTRIMITGDPTQIDNRFLDSRNNGLVFVTERFKDDDEFGHLTYFKSVRSRLAEKAARRLAA